MKPQLAWPEGQGRPHISGMKRVVTPLTLADKSERIARLRKLAGEENSGWSRSKKRTCLPREQARFSRFVSPFINLVLPGITNNGQLAHFAILVNLIVSQFREKPCVSRLTDSSDRNVNLT
jgi:hypothetical protein